MAIARFEVDALVCAVPRGDVAEFAADAKIGIDLGNDAVIEVEVAPVLDIGQGLADEVGTFLVALLVHPVRETVDHVLDDAVAVMHDRGADLDTGCAEHHELDCILPRSDAADAGDRDANLGIAAQ